VKFAKTLSTIMHSLSLKSTIAFGPWPRASLPSQPARACVPSRAASLRAKAFSDPVSKSELVQSLKGLETRLDDKLQNIETRLDDKLQNIETRLDEKLQKLETRLNDKLQKLETRLEDKAATSTAEVKGLQLLVAFTSIIVMALGSQPDSVLGRAVTGESLGRLLDVRLLPFSTTARIVLFAHSYRQCHRLWLKSEICHRLPEHQQSLCSTWPVVRVAQGPSCFQQFPVCPVPHLGPCSCVPCRTVNGIPPCSAHLHCVNPAPLCRTIGSGRAGVAGASPPEWCPVHPQQRGKAAGVRRVRLPVPKTLKTLHDRQDHGQEAVYI
jgi:hypothetical protein